MPDQPTLFASPGSSAPTAIFSPCGRMRFTLHHRWSEGPTWTWVMLNPSVAGGGETRDNLDPTLRRCMGFSKAGGAGALVVVNLFPWVGQDPADLWQAMDDGVDVTGGHLGNAHFLRVTCASRGTLVCRWGDFSKARRHHRQAAEAQAHKLLTTIRGTGRRPMALAFTRRGQPRHPLYLPAGLTPVPMEASDA